MIVPPATALRPPCGLPTRPIGRASIRSSICAGSAALLQADAYAGFHHLYESVDRSRKRPAGPMWGASFMNLQVAHAFVPLAAEALKRIAELYAIEGDIRGRPPRRERLQARTSVVLVPLPGLARSVATSEFGRGLKEVGDRGTIRYALGRWRALLRYAEDAHIEIDNNSVERPLRAVALERKNYLFAGSDSGGELGCRHL